jgi:hypothetical protein
MGDLNIVHDVLDAQLVDRRKRKIGRVDDLVLELNESGPPRVSRILVGGPVRAARVGPWMVQLERGLRSLGRVRRAGVSAIPFAAVRCIAETIEVDVEGDELDADHLEAWLAVHVVSRIPGSGSDAEDSRK